MSVRILTYAGLIYESLLKTLKCHTTIEKLPPIFSLVYYTGVQPWTAPTVLEGCFFESISEELKEYQPSIRYAIVDVERVDLKKYTIAPDNLVLPLLEIGKAKNEQQMFDVNSRIAKLLIDKEPQFKKAFYLYLEYMMKLPEGKLAMINPHATPQETTAMLQEAMSPLYRNGQEVGMEQGIEKGIKQGMEQGIEQGRRCELLFILTKLLERDYPEGVPTEHKARLEKSSLEELEKWILKIALAEEII